MEYDVPFGAVILTQRVHTPLLPSFFSVRTSGMSAPRATSDVDGSVLETELERIMEVEGLLSPDDVTAEVAPPVKRLRGANLSGPQLLIWEGLRLVAREPITKLRVTASAHHVVTD